MTEQEALRVVQNVAVSNVGPYDRINDLLVAVAVVTLANRIHMQQLKGELEDLRNDLDRVERQVWAVAGEG